MFDRLISSMFALGNALLDYDLALVRSGMLFAQDLLLPRDYRVRARDIPATPKGGGFPVSSSPRAVATFRHASEVDHDDVVWTDGGPSEQAEHPARHKWFYDGGKLMVLGRMIMNEERDTWAGVVFASAAMDEEADYLQRGRRFRTLSNQDLSRKWVSSFRLIRGNAPTRSVDLDDLDAEFRLRHFAPPYDQVADELESMREYIRREGPVVFRDVVRDYMNGLDKPRN